VQATAVLGRIDSSKAVKGLKHLQGTLVLRDSFICFILTKSATFFPYNILKVRKTYI